MNNDNIWANFKHNPTSDLKKQIIMNYVNLVHYVIHKSNFIQNELFDRRDYFQFGIEGLSEALEQVKRYHRECPELLSVQQLYVLTHIIKYYYSATWNTTEKFLFNWKEESGGNFEHLVKTFFARERIIKLLIDFIMFTRQDDVLQKIILRPHQMRAVDKIVERAKDSKKKRGLVWHTQGSGKTFTMIVAAQKIIKNPLFENPTVIMLVDRNELESQLFGNIKALGFGNVEVAESKNHLTNLLSDDRRGLLVTMIHKFDGMPADINTRKNIFIHSP